jgi:ferredoxin/flavodoxin
MNANFLLVYFSGTGGTKRIAGAFEKSLTDKGLGVFKHSLDRAEYSAVKPGYDEIMRNIDTVILLFPVYEFNAPIPVFEWAADLPEKNGLKAAVISVSGGGAVWPNTSCRVNIIKALERKGFEVFYENMMVMPPNMLSRADDHCAMRLLLEAPVRSAKIAEDIAEGVKRRERMYLSSRFLTLFDTAKRTRKMAAAMTINEKCTGCGWCARHCPRGNISNGTGKMVIGNDCVLCLRCVYGCPSKAITFGKKNFGIFKEGYDLDRLEMRMKGIDLDPVGKCCKGIIFLGIRKYLRKS